jgi:hypothetical protein
VNRENHSDTEAQYMYRIVFAILNVVHRDLFHLFPPYTPIDLFIYPDPNFAFFPSPFCAQRKPNHQTQRHHRAEREARRALREEATAIISR